MKTQFYVLGSLLTLLALTAVQGVEAAEQLVKVVMASQTEKQGESRPKDKSSTQSSKEPAAMIPPAETALTKEFREAAMLARLAIDQCEHKILEPKRIRTFYEEEADKAMTVADARTTNSADQSVYILLLKLHTMMLEEQIAVGKIRMSMGKNTQELDEALIKYDNCHDHLKETLSVAKYIGEGACADNSEQKTKPQNTEK